MFTIIITLIIFTFPVCFETAKPALRVVGGRSALVGEFPFVIAIEIKDRGLHCSGSALTPNWALTAAHCTRYIEKNDMTENCFITYCMFDKYGTSNIISIATHPAFKDDAYYAKNDIALVETEKMNLVTFAKLSSFDYINIVGQEVFAVGYGVTNTTGSRLLQLLKGILIPCKNTGKPLYPSLCLAASCDLDATLTNGDSGGPVVHSSGVAAVSSSSYVQLLQSRNKLVPSVRRPPAGIVTVVSPHIDWIRNVIVGNRPMVWVFRWGFHLSISQTRGDPSGYVGLLAQVVVGAKYPPNLTSVPPRCLAPIVWELNQL